MLDRYRRDFTKHGPARTHDLWVGRVGEDEARELRRSLDEAMGAVAGRGLADSRCEKWYLPPQKLERPRWEFAKARIEQKVGSAIDTIDRESDQIVANLCSPRASAIVTRGLVLGHVQSGKTTNFLSVAAKAADAGFDYVIILAGIHNSLRRQTQERAERTLLHQPDLWWTPTSEGDFREPAGSPKEVLQSRGTGARGLIVVKKNVHRLRYLADWLLKAPQPQKNALSVLVIDDEADQAGLDVSSEAVRSGIHEQLMRVLHLGGDTPGRVAYAGYTATPFANVLTSQADDGLYPRDFIYPLEKPGPHMGPPELFGEGVVGSPVHLVAPQPESDEPLGHDLEEALRWFVIATAARAAKAGGPDRVDSTMLIHTTMRVEPQNDLQPVVVSYLSQLQARLEDALPELRAQYESELARVPASGHDEEPASWEDLAPHLNEVLDRIVERKPAAPPFTEDGRTVHPTSGVIVDNGDTTSEERLTYLDPDRDDWQGVTIVAIGGNTLSRGLTLSGLVCSWFVRQATTYDSLMQMGRWFGYRPGYRHLTRLWTAPIVLERFRDLTDVELEFREELEWMVENQKTPAQYGPRIRLLPGMSVTRSSVMKAVQREYSFSDTVVGTIRVLTDAASIGENVKAVGRLVSSVGGGWRADSATWTAEAVPKAYVERLVSDYLFHPGDPRLGDGSLQRWMDANTGNPLLDSWTVAVAGRADGPSRIDLGGEIGEIGTVVRSKLRDSDGYLGVLVDPPDVRIGGGAERHPAKYRRGDEPPLLLIYPINAKSATTAKNREALEADEDLVGIAVVIPQMPGHGADHIRAALPPDAVARRDHADGIDRSGGPS